jgi:hypothetical protein
LKRYLYTQMIKDDLLKDIDERQLAVYLERTVVEAGERLTVSLMLPAVVLQEDRVVSDYPASLWQHIRATLGLKYKRTEVRITEVALFPEFKPAPLLGEMRLGIEARLTDRDYRDGPEVCDE